MVVVSKGRALANQNGVAPGDYRALIRAACHLLTQQKGADVVGRGGGVEHHAVVGDVFDVRGRLFDGGLVHSLSNGRVWCCAVNVLASLSVYTGNPSTLYTGQLGDLVKCPVYSGTLLLFLGTWWSVLYTVEPF